MSSTASPPHASLSLAEVRALSEIPWVPLHAYYTPVIHAALGCDTLSSSSASTATPTFLSPPKELPTLPAFHRGQGGLVDAHMGLIGLFPAPPQSEPTATPGDVADSGSAKIASLSAPVQEEQEAQVDVDFDAFFAEMEATAAADASAPAPSSAPAPASAPASAAAAGTQSAGTEKTTSSDSTGSETAGDVPAGAEDKEIWKASDLASAAREWLSAESVPSAAVAATPAAAEAAASAGESEGEGEHAGVRAWWGEVSSALTPSFALGGSVSSPSPSAASGGDACAYGPCEGLVVTASDSSDSEHSSDCENSGDCGQEWDFPPRRQTLVAKFLPTPPSLTRAATPADSSSADEVEGAAYLLVLTDLERVWVRRAPASVLWRERSVYMPSTPAHTPAETAVLTLQAALFAPPPSHSHHSVAENPAEAVCDGPLYSFAPLPHGGLTFCASSWVLARSGARAGAISWGFACEPLPPQAGAWALRALVWEPVLGAMLSRGPAGKHKGVEAVLPMLSAIKGYRKVFAGLDAVLGARARARTQAAALALAIAAKTSASAAEAQAKADADAAAEANAAAASSAAAAAAAAAKADADDAAADEAAAAAMEDAIFGFEEEEQKIANESHPDPPVPPRATEPAAVAADSAAGARTGGVKRSAPSDAPLPSPPVSAAAAAAAAATAANSGAADSAGALTAEEEAILEAARLRAEHAKALAAARQKKKPKFK